jgi:hypothetical protein
MLWIWRIPVMAKYNSLNCGTDFGLNWLRIKFAERAVSVAIVDALGVVPTIPEMQGFLP